MRNRLARREHAVQHRSRLQVYHVEAYVITEADVPDTVAAVHRGRKDAPFTDILDLSDDAVTAGIEDGQHRCGAEKSTPPVETDDAVVGLGTHLDAFDQIAVVRIDDKKSAVLSFVPP